jgi:hypothetical protein
MPVGGGRGSCCGRHRRRWSDCRRRQRWRQSSGIVEIDTIGLLLLLLLLLLLGRRRRCLLLA